MIAGIECNYDLFSWLNRILFACSWNYKDIFYGHTLKHNVGLIVVLCIGLELRLHDSKPVGIHQRVAIIGNFDILIVAIVFAFRSL